MHLIVVGKLKDKNLEAIENDYLKRIKNPKLSIYEVKAKAENKLAEGQEVIKKINSISSSPFSILMTEFGKEYYSPDFSNWLYKNVETHKDVFLIICGAEGPSDELKDFCQAKLSLGKMTLPHKLARIILVEQLYRAQTIRDGHPYHN